MDYTDNLVVMKCLPGTANTICALIDNLEWNGVMGTICGDDTILVICRGKENSVTFVDEVMSLLS
ncbi:Arginine repressor [compost metagenome]